MGHFCSVFLALATPNTGVIPIFQTVSLRRLACYPLEAHFSAIVAQPGVESQLKMFL
jgi:hypothetical protein